MQPLLRVIHVAQAFPRVALVDVTPGLIERLTNQVQFFLEATQ